jgi:hypothetical protein
VTVCRSTIYAIFEGTGEVPRPVVGRAVTGLPVR